MVRWACRLMVSTVVAAGCGSGQPHVQVRRLSSGEQVKVLGIEKINTSASGPSLRLRYQTNLNMDDTDAVRDEARRIWAEFRKDADQARVRSAVVSANAPPSGGGVITHSQTYNLVLERSEGGEWHEAPRD
jgi:hypothetical protein